MTLHIEQVFIILFTETQQNNFIFYNMIHFTSASCLATVLLSVPNEKWKKEFAKNKTGPFFDFGFLFFVCKQKKKKHVASVFRFETNNRFTDFSKWITDYPMIPRPQTPGPVLGYFYLNGGWGYLKICIFCIASATTVNRENSRCSLWSGSDCVSVALRRNTAHPTPADTSCHIM